MTLYVNRQKTYFWVRRRGNPPIISNITNPNKARIKCPTDKIIGLILVFVNNLNIQIYKGFSLLLQLNLGQEEDLKALIIL